MMEVKKFEAPTLAEALQVIKRELGPNAVILSTRTNRSGFGLLSKGSIEVTAAVSGETLKNKKAVEAKLSPAQLAALYQKPGQRVHKAYEVLSGSRLEKTLDAMESPRSSNSLMATSENPGNNWQKTSTQKLAATPASRMTQRRYADISDDDSVAEMATAFSSDNARISAAQPTMMDRARKQSISQGARPSNTPLGNLVSQALATNGNIGAFASTTSSSSMQSSSMGTNAGGQILPRLLAKLIDTGVDQEIVRDLGDELKLIIVREQITREEVACAHLGRLIMARLRVAKPLSERLRIPTTPRMIAFVGPTGVGKTTTIAKIAAELVINLRQPVVLATTDTFKIAAIDQLQTYANILKIPLEVCPNAESLLALQDSLGPDQVVLIDTAGYGPRDESKIFELRDTLAAVRTETHLCVGAMTRDRDLSDTIKRFKLFEPNYLVMTKLDETSSYGGILNVGVKSHLPLSYFTMGQRVPEDMEIATKERVADLLLNISGGA